MRASKDGRKLGGHGYWFWRDQCCTPRWAEGALRLAVRWNRFATAAMLWTCAKLFCSRPQFLVEPMMTDTLTRTTVGDESWYSYCLRSQLLVCFRPERLVVFDLVGWFVGGLKLCATVILGNGVRHRQVDGRALA